MALLVQDIRYAFRTLMRNPGFTAVAVLALALGIGPNSAIFSIVSAVILKTLPLHEPDRVVTIWDTWKSKGFDQLPVSPNNFLDWKTQSTSFESMSAAFVMPEFGFNVLAAGEPERVPGGKASAGFVEAMGVRPFLGRGFTAEEDRPGAPPVAMVSYGFWQRRLNADRSALGRTVAVDGVPRTVVGILPIDFSRLANVDVWIPTAIDPGANERYNHSYGVFARLKAGVTFAQAHAEMEGIVRRLAAQYPDTNAGLGVLVMPMRNLFSGPATAACSILMGAVGLLLLMACANMANLLLARSVGRSKELAVRTALGAQRSRIIRQLVTESLVLSLAGGVLGLALAYWCVGLVRGIVPDFLAIMKGMTIDLPVVLFTMGLSILTGILFSVLPAWKASRADVNAVLKSSGRGGTSHDVQRARSLLLVTEVALTVVLAVGAGLLARSFVGLLSVNPGLRTANVLTMQVTLPWVNYKEPHQRVAFHRDAMRRIESLPGVQAAAAINLLPMRSYFLNSRMSVWGFHVEGEPAPDKGHEPLADFRVVTPHFFKAMNIAVRDGRVFTDRDDVDTHKIAVVNETLVRKHMGGRYPVGRRLVLEKQSIEIVGVVADAKLYGLDSAVEPAIYTPHAQRPNDVMSVVVHSTQDPASLATAIRREIQAIDSQQPIADVRTMEAVVSDSLMLRRVAMAFISAFALLALTLATVGIYGLTAYSISQQMQEIGVRIALGAQKSHVLRLVVGRGLCLAGVGIVLGLAGAFAGSNVLKRLLFGVTSTDPLVMFGVPLVLFGVATLASYLPARRATKIDPIIALRVS
ncbi:MAG TPA: ABC transporter permease [Bryobacteraceae bacterium]|nr:ABC transporter permease [Bryobacteraceae bacterium]